MSENFQGCEVSIVYLELIRFVAAVVPELYCRSQMLQTFEC